MKMSNHIIIKPTVVDGKLPSLSRITSTPLCVQTGAAGIYTGGYLEEDLKDAEPVGWRCHNEGKSPLSKVAHKYMCIYAMNALSVSL